MTQLTPSHFHVNKKRAHDNRYFAAGVNVKSSSIFLKTTSCCLCFLYLLQEELWCIAPCCVMLTFLGRLCANSGQKYNIVFVFG